ncbi:MAG: helix-turn-helix transcriptional regulator [Bacteroidota bacterium]
MTEEIAQIAFNYTKSQGIDFDIVRLEDLLDYPYSEFDPLRPHRVEFYVLLLVTSGVGKHAIDFQEHDYRGGSVLTIRKDQIHKYFPRDVEGVNLLFTEEFVVSHLDVSGAQRITELFNELLFCQHTPLDPDIFRDLRENIQLIQREFTGPRDEYTSEIIRNLLQVVISKLHRARISDIKLNIEHKYIQQFLQFQSLVQRNVTTSRSVHYYADQLHVTPKTLYNITQKSIRKSPKAFIDEELMLQIKRRLINSSMSIKEIAFQSGFDDPGNFFKFFKRLAGETPQSFRRIHLPV